MIKPLSSILKLSCFLLVLASCTKDPVTNQVPVADAGNGKTITLPTDTVTVTGTGTDADGKVVAWLWSQVSGPSASTIVNPGSPSTQIKFFAAGTYLFQLMVTDNLGATGVDTVSVIVVPPSIKTLTLQPDNNTNEYSVTVLGGSNSTGPTIASLEADTWTSGGQLWILRGVVKFDLSAIPTTAVIKTANLYLYSNPTPTTGDQINANSGSTNSFTIQQISSNWSTSTISWSNQPSTTTTNQAVIASTTQSVLDLNVDVTAMVASMVNNNANYGFLLKLQNEVTYNSRIFVSSHNATYPTKHPKLVITYQ